MSVERNYKPGDELVPGYKLVNFLGRGGFGQVWKTAAPGGTLCAIKMILLKDKMALKEFRAIRLVKLIRHPNLTPILAIWLKDENGNLINENADVDSVLLKGRDFELIVAMGLGDKNLLDRLEECRDQGLTAIPVDELLNYMEASAKAIDFLNRPTSTSPGGSSIGDAHKAIQHCDIKPQNILIVGGEAQVCDFGLARAADEIRKTSSGAASYCYVAPELISNQTTKSTDQYSLAISYYELRTGNLPFHAQSLPQVIQVHLQGTLDFALLPPEEQKALKRATSVKAEERWPTCLEMVKALRRAVEGTTSSQSSSSGSGAGFEDLIGLGPLQPGGKLVPDHRLVRLLGKGSYGEVWEATTGAGGAMKVALKVIRGLQRQHGQQEFKALELVCQEEIAHHHLLEVRNFWLLDDKGMPIKDEIRNKPGAPVATTLVISMRLALKSLLQRLKEYQSKPGHQGGIPLDELLPYMRQAAEAIDYLNTPQFRDGREISIQHRDIKPENILLDRNNQVKVADFGLAKVLEGSKAAITGDSLGFTPNYAAPEYFKNVVTPWSDQYSLAITYYHLRVGRLPFQGSTAEEVVRVHQEGRLDFGALPPKEQDVLRAATAMNPEDRYPTCQEMVSALEDASGWIPPEGPNRKPTGRTTQRPQLPVSGQWPQGVNPHGPTMAPMQPGPGYRGGRSPATQHEIQGMPTGQLPLEAWQTQQVQRPGYPVMGPGDTAVDQSAMTQRPMSDPNFLAHVQEQDPRMSGSNPNLGLMGTSPLPPQYQQPYGQPGYAPQGYVSTPYGPRPPSMYDYPVPPSSKKWIWMTGVAVLVVAGLGVGGYIATRPPGKITEPPVNPGPDPVRVDVPTQIAQKLDDLKKILAESDPNPDKLDAASQALTKLLDDNQAVIDASSLELQGKIQLALAEAYHKRQDMGRLEYRIKILKALKDKLPSESALKNEIEEALKKLNPSIMVKRITGGGSEDKDLLEQYNKAINDAYALIDPQKSGGRIDPRTAALKFRDISKLGAKFKDEKLLRQSRETTAIGLARAEWLNNNIEGVQEALSSGAAQPLPENEAAVKALQCLVALKNAGPGSPRLTRLMELAKAGDLVSAKFGEPELTELKKQADRAKTDVLRTAIGEEDLTKARELTDKVLDFDNTDALALAHRDVLDAIKSKDSAAGISNLESVVVKPGAIPRRAQVGSILLAAAIKDPKSYKDRVRTALNEAAQQVKGEGNYAEDYRNLLGERIELDLVTGASPKELAKSRDDMKEASRSQTPNDWAKAALAEVAVAEPDSWGQARDLYKEIETPLKGKPFLRYLHGRILAHQRAGNEGNVKQAAGEILGAYSAPPVELKEATREAAAAAILLKAAELDRDRNKKEYFEARYLPGKADEAAGWLKEAKALLEDAKQPLPSTLEMDSALSIAEGQSSDKSSVKELAKKLVTSASPDKTVDADQKRLVYLVAKSIPATATPADQGLMLDCYSLVLGLFTEKEIESSDRLKEVYDELIAPVLKQAPAIEGSGDAALKSKLARFFLYEGRILTRKQDFDTQRFPDNAKARYDAFDHAIKLDGSVADYYAERGRALTSMPKSQDIAAEQNRLKGIEEDEIKVRQLDPTNPVGPTLVAYLDFMRAQKANSAEEQIKLYEDAEKEAARAISLCRENARWKDFLPQYLVNHVQVCISLGQFKKNPDFYRQAIKDVNDAKIAGGPLFDTLRAHRSAGLAYELLGEYGKAADEYQTALDSRNLDKLKQAQLSYDRGRCQYLSVLTSEKGTKRSLLDGAIGELRKSVQVYRDQASGKADDRLTEAVRSLARAYSLRSKDTDLKDALACYLEAIQREKNVGLLLDHIAEGSQVALEINDGGAATQIANAAKAIPNIDPYVLALAEGRAMELRGEAKEAQARYQSVVDQDKNRSFGRALTELALARLICRDSNLLNEDADKTPPTFQAALTDAIGICQDLSTPEARLVMASACGQQVEAYGQLIKRTGVTPEQMLNSEQKSLEAMEVFVTKANVSSRDSLKWWERMVRTTLYWMNTDPKGKDELRNKAKLLIEQAIASASDPNAKKQLEALKGELAK